MAAGTGQRRGLPRHTKILFGLILGLVLGLTAHAAAGDQPWVEWAVRNLAYPVGQIFLRLIFMIVVPLVFSSLVLGVLAWWLMIVGAIALTVPAPGRHQRG